MRKSTKPKALWTQAFPEQRSERNGTGRHSKEELAQYRRKARTFVNSRRLLGDRCPVVAAVSELRYGTKYGHRISDKLTENHHKRGRAGSLLLDERHWLAVSKQGHRWIHQHPAQARDLGFLCADGLWNVPDRTPSKKMEIGVDSSLLTA